MASSSPKTVTLEQFKEHTQRKNLYVLLSGKVYDVSKFIDEHPGGDEVLLAQAGQDATDSFEDVGHSDEAREFLPDFYVGDIDEAAVGVLKKEVKAAAQSLQTAIDPGSNFTFLIPVALLGAYFAWRYYSASA
ncbi:cytochrome b5-like heme/steroid binding domain-containing protein [Pterulicium gracile]|uniref:Cytochrome b5-like heme/steroid binding domain-containing protein n=1 Tax=Pterulicium gracile TaxID=1884261 RepID=A0A5C3Q080_9AGAR|nr:cytochrome b5-like heme/steroid binding domain-containing protein [Pterula gracilis]